MDRQTNNFETKIINGEKTMKKKSIKDSSKRYRPRD